MFQDLSLQGVGRVHVAPAPTSGNRRASLAPPAQPRRVVRGAADMTACEEIREFFTRCTRTIQDDAGALVIDLGRVEQADTKLMACLVAVFQLARASSVRVELWSSSAVLDMIEFCRLRWLLEHAGIED